MRVSSILISTIVPALAAASCNHDNCLREVLATPAATAFCMTYTSGVQTAATGLPTYLSQCSSNPSRISSACSCGVTTTLSTTVATPTTTTVGTKVCNNDNCLRQILATPAATTFCDAYTHGIQTASTGLPTFVSQCSSNPSKISSACSCAATPSPTSCVTPTSLCGTSLTGYCSDLTSDPQNCGTCGNICPSSTPDCCGGTCVDESTDTNNCGSCNGACMSGDTCSDGMCSTAQCQAPAPVRRAIQNYCPGDSHCGLGPVGRWAHKNIYGRWVPPQESLSVKRKSALAEKRDL